MTFTGTRKIHIQSLMSLMTFYRVLPVEDTQSVLPQLLASTYNNLYSTTQDTKESKHLASISKLTQAATFASYYLFHSAEYHRYQRGTTIHDGV